jgi:membrane protease YdiL (CAAX protease family)
MTRSAAIADIAIVLAVLFAFVVLPAVARPVAGVAVGQRWYLWAVAGGVVSLVTVALRLRRRRQTPADIGLGPAPASRVLGATLAALPLCYAAGITAALLAGSLAPGGLEGMARQKFEFLRAVAVIPPGLVLPVSLFVGLYEEILFRGFLLARLRVLAGGSAVAPVCLTTALFGLLHFPQGVVGVAQTGAVGLVLALVVVRSGTVWPAVLAHATIDTVSLTLAGRLAERFPGG